MSCHMHWWSHWGNTLSFSHEKIQMAVTFCSDGLRKFSGPLYRLQITHTFDFWHFQSDWGTQKNLATKILATPLSPRGSNHRLHICTDTVSTYVLTVTSFSDFSETQFSRQADSLWPSAAPLLWCCPSQLKVPNNSARYEMLTII